MCSYAYLDGQQVLQADFDIKGVHNVAGVLQDLLPSLCPRSEHLARPPRGRSLGPARPPAAQTEQPGDSEASGSIEDHIEEEDSRGVQRRGGNLLLHDWLLRVLIAGISVSLDATMHWLHSTLHHPDFFLYIVVHLDGRKGGKV